MSLVATLAAVRALLQPLKDANTIARIHNGPQAQMNEYPAAEVRFGPSTVGRQPQGGILERQHARAGVVRLYVRNEADLGAAYATYPALIDAIEDAFRAAPSLTGAADRFDATGNGALTLDETVNALYVDIGWTVIETEPDTFVQDW